MRVSRVLKESTELSYLMSDVLQKRKREREIYGQMSQTQLMISSSLEPVLRDQEWSNT